MAPLSGRWLRFNLVGLGGIVVQVAALTTLVDVADAPVLPATVLAVGAAIGHNFLWHLAWTWRDRRLATSPALLLARFVTANGLISLGGNAVVVTALVDGARLPVWAASLVAIAICGLVNYVVADRLVFLPPTKSR